MSLITHCPHCGTTFKVVQDQLRISDGWVRCGHCTEVFDSTPNLRELDLAAATQAQAPAPAHSSDVPDVSSAPEAALEKATQSEVFVVVEQSAPQESPPSEALPQFQPSQSLAESVDRMSSLLGEKAHHFSPTDLGTSERTSERTSESATPAAALPAETAPAPDFSFIATAADVAHPHRPWVSWSLVVFCGLLLLALAGQLVVHERDRIAALQPQLRPVLRSLCGVVHCQIRPWRHIEAISVEASAFNKVRGDTYRLSFSLRNSAPMVVAQPAIELTLTDSQDMPLLRRVVRPDELSPPSDVLAAGGEWSGGALVALAGGSAFTQQIAGYRILAFYP